MAQVLYRKYRPRKFSDVIGQQHVVTTLLNAIKAENVAHAYLFAGPRGTGKTTIARLIAKAVNCEKTKGAEPCGNCDSCKSFEEGKALDLIEIDAASNRGIDEVRELREKIRFAPSKLKFKVYIVDEVHMLTKEAFNALLKTLEEPPEHAIFILATTEIHKLPATVISRCQRFDLKKLSPDELLDGLDKIAKSEKIETEKGVLEFIAREADGGARDAISLLGQASAFAKKEITMEDVRGIVGMADFNLISGFAKLLGDRDIKGALVQIQKLTDRGLNPEQFMRGLIQFFRQSLVGSFKTSDVISKDEKEKISEVRKKLTVPEIRRVIQRLQEALREQKDAVHVQLPLELAVVDICAPKEEMTSKPSEKIKKTFKPKKEEKTLEEEGQSPQGGLNLINDKWGEVIQYIQKKNYALGSFLKMGKLSCKESGCVLIGFPYKFHKEQIDNEKNRSLIEKSIKKITRQKIKVKGVIVGEDSGEVEYHEQISVPAPKEEKREENSDDLVGKAMKIFGGKVID